MGRAAVRGAESRSESRFRGVTWQGHTYDVSIGPDKTEVVRDGKLRFHADAGVVVRNYVVSSASLSMAINSGRDFDVNTGEFGAGSLNLTIDGKAIKKITVIDGAASFAIPSGQHAVELRAETR